MTDLRDQPLAPADFTPASDLLNAEPPPPPPRLRGWLPAGLALFALLWVVVFFLPDWVGTSTQPTVSATVSTPIEKTDAKPNNPQASKPAVNAGSPFADAQLARARREAQDILQPLLELQAFLEERGVEQWATEAYREALALANSGDTAYRERDFAAATAAYLAASTALEKLEQALPEAIEQRVAQVTEAIEGLDPARATAVLPELRLMAPDSPHVASLDERLAALPELMVALEQAAAAAQDDDIDAAVGAAERAVALDPLHKAAAAVMTEHRESQRLGRFRTAMSEGYNALTDADFDRAEARFAAAAKLAPGAPEPATARLELASARTAATLRGLRDDAARLEQEERWSDALQKYQQALDTDATLVFATEGHARTKARAALSDAVAAILDAPERLVENAALTEAQSVLAQLQAQTDTGPRYQAQRAALEKLLVDAQTPVTVQFQSDGLTDVTIARVRHLGRFTDDQLVLRPGRYTAVGIRDGFVDVRVSFDVVVGVSSPTVMVRCTEAI